jgi:hypothetical protein
MNIQLTVDTADLNRLAQRLSKVRNLFPEHLAKAMTYAAYDAQKKLKAETHNYINAPTRWTVNSTFVRRASPTDLSVSLGFKDQATKGTPAARYLQPIVAGEPRPQKSSEKQLARTSSLFGNLFLVPTGKAPLPFNTYGNIPASKYTQVLSRLKALGEQGYTANASASPRSKSKRRQTDFFIGFRGGRPVSIRARVGPTGPRGGAPRGYVNVFNITKQPTYKAQFPVRSILQAEFTSRFPSIFERIVFTGK